MSQRYWGLDWESVLPWVYEDVRVELSNLEEVEPLVRAAFPATFGDGSERPRFLPDPMTEAKRRFYAEVDVFAFRRAGQLVGLATAHPSDWSTYYVRMVFVLPTVRDRKVASRFSESLMGALAAVGVERIEVETSPANVPVLRLFVAQRWTLTSTTNSERWGTTLRFTKFLRAEAEETFLRQFCVVPRLDAEIDPHSATERRPL